MNGKIFIFSAYIALFIACTDIVIIYLEYTDTYLIWNTLGILQTTTINFSYFGIAWLSIKKENSRPFVFLIVMHIFYSILLFIQISYFQFDNLSIDFIFSLLNLLIRILVLIFGFRITDTYFKKYFINYFIMCVLSFIISLVLPIVSNSYNLVKFIPFTSSINNVLRIFTIIYFLIQLEKENQTMKN